MTFTVGRTFTVGGTFTTGGGGEPGTAAGFFEVRGLRLRLDVKQRSDSGMGTADHTDGSGTPVAFNVAFVDVDSITVTPGGTTARFAVYDFTDTPNPTGFTVYLFDKDGTRVSGPFSWAAKGV